jgi:hypothetical protein
MLRDAAEPDGLRRVVAREVVEVLRRYQFDNPVERSLPAGCDIHPYWAVLRAASLLLNWRVHWDEVNREIMRLTKDEQVDGAAERIAAARADASYAGFIGGASNNPGVLSARTHPADVGAPTGKTPEGQLRDQRMTPFLKRVGFGELLLESPGSGGGGYWTVPAELRDLVTAAVASPPEPAGRTPSEVVVSAHVSPRDLKPAFLPWAAAMEKGYSCPLWLTYKQAAELGGQVRKGEHGSLVVYADKFTKEGTDDNGAAVEIEIPFLKGYTVFNAEQIDGLPGHFYATVPPLNTAIDRLDSVEQFFANTKITIQHGGSRAFYSPDRDLVQMPELQSFRDGESYYATLSHECCHAIRHESRLNPTSRIGCARMRF